ncbi:hypothetical protein E4Z66_02755 [Aliishimia ponticola]|uniref:Uncharacterized protein n=1 Tax=Aliishimia ponticola TaxID=2499833 RepID=A0A4S4NIG4_9RHOB|nr:hypothetical protein [Aliishimia ponticola]THH38507.1 hypothetical protein E4Z66_02755 [Aliishimia ponticola]
MTALTATDVWRVNRFVTQAHVIGAEPVHAASRIAARGVNPNIHTPFGAFAAPYSVSSLVREETDNDA